MKIETFSTNIGCTEYHDCGSCTYYYKCATKKLYVNDTKVSKDNFDEIKRTFKLGRKKLSILKKELK